MPKLSNKTLRCCDGRDGRNRSFEDKHHYCHDDRVSRSSDNLYHSNRSKVLFKTQARRARDVPRYVPPKHMNQNVEITINSNNNRQIIITDRNNGTLPGRKRRVRVATLKQLPLEESRWYKITIPHGYKHEKDYILSNLLNCTGNFHSDNV